MEILKYASGQYAGITGQEVSFQPGMNVILGDNETGKSTMVTGLYDTLFMHSKLDGRKDKEFTASRFPTGGGNSIDGEIKLNLDGREVTIKKEWDKSNMDSRTVLILEEVGRFTGKAAEEKIGEMFPHGLGIYDNIVFGRQNNENAILDWYFDFVGDMLGKKVDSEVLSARRKVSQAFSAASGISEEEYQRKLEERLNALGSHWDFSLQGPEGGRGLRNRWGRGVGQILQAYYNLEERKQAADDAQKAFSELDRMKTRLESLQFKRKNLEKKAQELQAQESSAALISSRQSLEKDIVRLEQALKAWPEFAREVSHLIALRQESDEQQNRTRKVKLSETIEKVNRLQARRMELLKLAEPLHDIEKDMKAYHRAMFDGENARKLLNSGKLHASVAMESGYTARLSTAAGEAVEISTTFEQDVDSFVKIEIPGVGKLTVAPQNLDIQALERRMKECRASAGEILAKYHAGELVELEGREEAYHKTLREIDRIDAELARIPGCDNAAQLENERDSIAVHENVIIREELESAIDSALKGRQERSLPERIAVVQSALRGYENDFTSLSHLEEQVHVQRGRSEEILAKLASLPAFTLTVEEFERQKRETAALLTGPDGNGGLVQEIERLIGELRVKESYLDNISMEELQEEIQVLTQEFERNKKLHAQYSRIKEDFLRLKDEQEDQFGQFYDQFNEYLSLVTDRQVRLEDGRTLKSGHNLLTAKQLLSRGTKQTILLAFRLALLKFYYQDEPGVIVLDDTLLDMDPGRRESSVKLLQEFAQDNQVIFTTCDPAIAGMLGGNLVRLE